MSSPSPAQLIADNLAAIPQADGGVIQLPGFQARLLPEPLQEQVGRTAADIGAGIVHLLTTNGYRIVTAGQDAGGPAPQKPLGAPTAALVCRLCSTTLIEMTLTDPARVVTDGPALLRALAGRSQDCPHGRV